MSMAATTGCEAASCERFRGRGVTVARGHRLARRMFAANPGLGALRTALGHIGQHRDHLRPRPRGRRPGGSITQAPGMA